MGNRKIGIISLVWLNQTRVEEVVRTVRNLEDKGRVSTSALLYGHGDGGGGPTREMLERARRLANIDGCPRYKIMLL